MLEVRNRNTMAVNAMSAPSNKTSLGAGNRDWTSDFCRFGRGRPCARRRFGWCDTSDRCNSYARIFDPLVLLNHETFQHDAVNLGNSIEFRNNKEPKTKVGHISWKMAWGEGWGRPISFHLSVTTTNGLNTSYKCHSWS